MSFMLLKSFDDRRTCDKSVSTALGRTWVRRIQWLEPGANDGPYVKLKLEVGEFYKEVLADKAACKTIWDRFKAGASITDAISILANPVPKVLQSRRARRQK